MPQMHLRSWLPNCGGRCGSAKAVGSKARKEVIFEDGIWALSPPKAAPVRWCIYLSFLFYVQIYTSCVLNRLPSGHVFGNESPSLVPSFSPNENCPLANVDGNIQEKVILRRVPNCSPPTQDINVWIGNIQEKVIPRFRLSLLGTATLR